MKIRQHGLPRRAEWRPSESASASFAGRAPAENSVLWGADIKPGAGEVRRASGPPLRGRPGLRCAKPAFGSEQRSWVEDSCGDEAAGQKVTVRRPTGSFLDGKDTGALTSRILALPILEVESCRCSCFIECGCSCACPGWALQPSLQSRRRATWLPRREAPARLFRNQSSGRLYRDMLVGSDWTVCKVRNEHATRN